MFPWKRYGDEIDMRSLADCRADVVERAELACGIAGRQGIECVFFSALGMDLWRRGEPDPGPGRGRASPDIGWRSNAASGVCSSTAGRRSRTSSGLHRGGGHAAACLGEMNR